VVRRIAHAVHALASGPMFVAWTARPPPLRLLIVVRAGWDAWVLGDPPVNVHVKMVYDVCCMSAFM